jgi:transcriptional regulator GlxA family with amidase domain
VFKSVTKKSAMEYLRDYRLQVANALLSGTDSPVGEIAERCGFESPNYFSRCYKRYYGKSPREGRLEKRSAMTGSEE